MTPKSSPSASKPPAWTSPETTPPGATSTLPCDALSENGRDYFHRISRFYPGYTEKEADAQYDKCLRAHGTGITIKTFFLLAKDAGISVSIPSQT